MSKGGYNKSKTYLLPLLSELLSLRIDYMDFLKNTYVNFDMEGYDGCIGILHDFSFKNPEFTKYENQLTSNELFVDLVDIDNQVLYIFRMPEEYMHEYEQFRIGKYSRFGTDAKELILSFWGEVYSEKVSAVSFLLTLKQVLFKDKRLKQKLEKDLSSKGCPIVLDDDAELSSIMDEVSETFEIKEYKKTKDESKV